MRQIVKAFAEASGREIPTRMAPRRPGDVAQVVHPPGGRGVPWETGARRAGGYHAVDVHSYSFLARRCMPILRSRRVSSAGRRSWASSRCARTRGGGSRPIRTGSAHPDRPISIRARADLGAISMHESCAWPPFAHGRQHGADDSANNRTDARIRIYYTYAASRSPARASTIDDELAL